MNCKRIVSSGIKENQGIPKEALELFTSPKSTSGILHLKRTLNPLALFIPLASINKKCSLHHFFDIKVSVPAVCVWVKTETKTKF